MMMEKLAMQDVEKSNKYIETLWSHREIPMRVFFITVITKASTRIALVAADGNWIKISFRLSLLVSAAMFAGIFFIPRYLSKELIKFVLFCVTATFTHSVIYSLFTSNLHIFQRSRHCMERANCCDHFSPCWIVESSHRCMQSCTDNGDKIIT